MLGLRTQSHWRLGERLTVPPVYLRLAFGFVVSILLIITAVRYYSKAAKPSRLGEQTRTAFLRWRPQILGLETGNNIYVEHNYPNPPIMALVLYPFTKLPPLVGAMTWFWLKVGFAYAMFGSALAILRRPGDEQQSLFATWGVPLAGLFSLHPILGDLSHGNVNLFIGVLVLGSLYLFTRRWDITAGVVLALAIACKVTPLLFLPYFLWKRSVKLLVGCLIGLALWLFIVPGCLLGWSYNETLLTSWFNTMVKPFVLEGKVWAEHHNQSLPGLSYRLLTHEPSFIAYDDDEQKPYGTAYHNLVSWSPRTVQVLLKSAMVAFALAVVLLCRWPTHRPSVPRAGPLLAAEFSLILVGMLLFSERTWKHHAVILVLPFCLLAWLLFEATLTRRSRILLSAALVLLGLLMWLPSMLAEELQDIALVYGSTTAAFVVLLLACGSILLVARRHPDHRIEG